MMVARERGKVLKNGALVGLFDMGLQRQIALRLGQPEHRVQHAEQFEIAGLVVRRAFDQFSERFGGSGQDLLRIGDDEGADGATKNNDEFERLPKNAKVATASQVSTNDGTDDNDETDEKEHGLALDSLLTA
jgi:hypothetical protein